MIKAVKIKLLCLFAQPCILFYKKSTRIEILNLKKTVYLINHSFTDSHQLYFRHRFWIAGFPIIVHPMASCYLPYYGINSRYLIAGHQHARQKSRFRLLTEAPFRGGSAIIALATGFIYSLMV